MLTGQTLINASLTLGCSCLSLTGSVLIILSYLVARTRSTPKSAYLILHLAASDFVWFLCGAVLSALWIFNDGSVPAELCFIASPTISFARMASLIWTVVISFNVLMSVQKRKWFWKSQEAAWERYRKVYFAVIFVLATPGTLLSIINQHKSGTDSNSLGCSPGYEPLGVWYEIFFTELLPISIGFLVNLYVLLTVRRKMSKSAFPQSVRKRRKRVMYHYTIVCILCWIPTILQYLLEISGSHSSVLEIVARTCLYASGFLNFLVFGMQDPHLKRSFDVVLARCGCGFCAPLFFSSASASASFYASGGSLKASDVDKSVMFEEKTICRNADLAKDKKSIYRNRKLSREDKISLYQQRPDLNPRFKCAPAPEVKRTSTSHSTSSSRSTSPAASRRSETRNPLVSSASDLISKSAIAVPRDSDDIQMEAPLLEHQTLRDNHNHTSGNTPYKADKDEECGRSSDSSHNSSSCAYASDEDDAFSHHSAEHLVLSVCDEDERRESETASSPVKEMLLPRRLTGGVFSRDRDLESEGSEGGGENADDTSSSSDEADEEDEDLNAL